MNTHVKQASGRLGPAQTYKNMQAVDPHENTARQPAGTSWPGRKQRECSGSDPGVDLGGAPVYAIGRQTQSSVTAVTFDCVDAQIVSLLQAGTLLAHLNTHHATARDRTARLKADRRAAVRLADTHAHIRGRQAAHHCIGDSVGEKD
jgi:hypothetical protein